MTYDDRDYGAFAAGGSQGDWQTGLTKSQYAAIRLKFCDDNTEEWLDQMIWGSSHKEYLKAALASGLCPCNPNDFLGIASWCSKMATVMTMDAKWDDDIETQADHLPDATEMISCPNCEPIRKANVEAVAFTDMATKEIAALKAENEKLKAAGKEAMCGLNLALGICDGHQDADAARPQISDAWDMLEELL